jgi:hypothetical protein
MKFQASEVKQFDFSKLKGGEVANATLTSFNYRSGYCFGTFVADGESVNAIIGSQEQYPIKDVLPLKGIEATIMFVGTKVVDTKTYPRYAISF